MVLHLSDKLVPKLKVEKQEAEHWVQFINYSITKPMFPIQWRHQNATSPVRANRRRPEPVEETTPAWRAAQPSSSRTSWTRRSRRRRRRRCPFRRRRSSWWSAGRGTTCRSCARCSSPARSCRWTEPKETKTWSKAQFSFQRSKEMKLYHGESFDHFFKWKLMQAEIRTYDCAT